MPHDNKSSELDRRKDRINNLVSTRIYVPYEKKKSVEWTVEKIIDNRNIHSEESGDFHPVYDYRHMDPTKINPLKNFLEIFPEKEMEKCVKLFNTEVRDHVELANTVRETKYSRNKNTYYLKKLTIGEFKIFLGLLLAATTRVESGINLWKEYRPTKHYFNNAPNFGKYMSKIRFQKIRKFFSKCFCDPEMKQKDPR